MGNNLLFPQPQLPVNSIDEKNNSLGYVLCSSAGKDGTNNTITRVFCVSKPLNNSESKQIKETLVNPDINITTCHLLYQLIDTKYVKDIRVALENENCKLTKLHIGGCHIGMEGMKEIAQALKSDKSTLLELIVFSNDIGDTGAKELSIALAHPNCKLNYLDVEYNGITDVGIQYLMDSMEHSKITALAIGNNNLTRFGMKIVSNCLMKKNCKIDFISIGNIDEKGLAEIRFAVINSHCTRISMMNARGTCKLLSEMGIRLVQINAGLVFL